MTGQPRSNHEQEPGDYRAIGVDLRRAADPTGARKPRSPIRQAAAVLSDDELGDALDLWYAARRQPDHPTGGDRDALREAIARTLAIAHGYDPEEKDLTGTTWLWQADTLLAGPLAPLLAERERVRALVRTWQEAAEDEDDPGRVIAYRVAADDLRYALRTDA
jgi:hypothetical protein